MHRPDSIPRPLVRANQWVIVLAVLLSWITAWSGWLVVPLVAGLLGRLFGWNPVMRFAKLFLRKDPSTYVPEDRRQQEFSQTIAIVCLAVALIAHAFRWTAVYWVFSAMVAVAAFVAILGFCVGCFLHYQWTQYRYRQHQRAKHV
ncbi:DUF4395 domain-containing protein [Alicyclobacillus sp.]|uniref:DUF4395 domain-containing protein n=1 Tax=Alicyclobacillus sp. TaxID=61169 RepID=UPI0025C619FA|nr:DUF4395 domain-containing protein [Alicyclobacillus sp.]MCL6516649.1 DUF4395 domain-containing protein [Alicyclobacillus sp.]